MHLKKIRKCQQRGLLKNLKALQLGFLNWKLGGHKLSKTNNTGAGSASVSTVRRHIEKGVIHHFRIEILQYHSKKDYSCVKRNMEGVLFNNKALQKTLGKF